MDPHAAIWENCLETAVQSDVGLRRANNQDSLAVLIASSQEKFQERGHLFVVADGMGAHAAGELASKMATDNIPLTYGKLLDRLPHEALLAAVQDANNQIYTRGSASDDFRGMGTTVSVLVVLPQGAIVAQVGDSRVYRLRGNQLEQLTFDHSLVWELRAAGQIPGGAAPSYIPKNIITRSLGPNPEVQVDIEGPFPLQVGDTFLLCSDGLSGQVKDEEIGKILAVLPPKEAVQTLVDLANLRGGPDNITVIIARVAGPLVAKGASPVAPSRPRGEPRPVHPAIWGAAGGLALLAVALFVMAHPLAAMASLAAAVMSAATGLVMRYGGGAETVFGEQPLGKGPYVRWHCDPDLAFVSELAKISQQLRDAAAAAAWAIDWQTYNDCDSRAINAAREGKYAEAAREQCRAISFMMQQLRRQGGGRRTSLGGFDFADFS